MLQLFRRQFSNIYPKNSMDGEAWWTTVYGVAKSQTRLSDFTSLSLGFRRYLLLVLRMDSMGRERMKLWVRSEELKVYNVLHLLKFMKHILGTQRREIRYKWGNASQRRWCLRTSIDGNRGPGILGKGNSMKEIQGSANTGYKAPKTQEERFPQLSIPHLILEYLNCS